MYLIFCPSHSSSSSMQRFSFSHSLCVLTVQSFSEWSGSVGRRLSLQPPLHCANALVLSYQQLTVWEMTENVIVFVGSCFTIRTENMDERRVSQNSFHEYGSREWQNSSGSTATYSPSLSPGDFFLLPKLKVSLKECRFEPVEERK
jgi:hypothetical protein